jgi:hypothetical protein
MRAVTLFIKQMLEEKKWQKNRQLL